MAYILRWEAGGKERSYSTTSLYELTKKKNQLKEVGLEYKEVLTGDEKKTEKNQAEIKKWKEINENLSTKNKQDLKELIIKLERVKRLKKTHATKAKDKAKKA